MRPDYVSRKIARWLSYLIILILALLPFHEFFVVWIGSNTGHLDLLRIWKEILIAAMAPFAGWLIWREQAVRDWFKKSWVIRLYLLYVLLHLGLGFWALHTRQVNRTALIYALLINLRFIGFFVICAAVAIYNDLLKKYWRQILLIPSAIVIVFGLAQEYLLSYNFLRHFGYGPKTIPAYETVDNNLKYQRIQATLRGANPLGAYLSLILPAFIVAKLKNAYLKIVFMAAGLVVIFYTYSRSAWVGLVITALSLVYLRRQKINAKLIGALIGTVVVLSGGAYLFHNSQLLQDTLLHTSSASTSKQSSNSQRNSALKNGLSDIIHQPLGRGPGTAGPASFRNDHPARIAENYYLQIGQEVGLIGMLLFLLINLGVAKYLYENRQDSLSKLLLASLIGISFINLLSHAWADDTLSLLWWGLAGVDVGSSLSVGILKAGSKNGKPQKT